MRLSEYLVYIIAILLSFWLSFWLFDNIHEATGLAGIGLALLLILWALEAAAEDIGSSSQRRQRNRRR